MKKIINYILFISGIILVIIPRSSFAYKFDSSSREENVKRTRREIYDLYSLYEEVVHVSSEPQFGVIGYNGVCSTVTVDGGTVTLEDYVAGVVKAESGSESDNPELLKAQAIAARSYLLASKKNASNCSVTNGESYQAYKKVNEGNATDKKYIEAAMSTAGQVVSRNGSVALTQYLSYPNAIFCSEDSSGWHVKMQKFSDDKSTAWTWNGPSKATVLAGNNYASKSGAPSKSHHFGMSQTIAGYLTRVEKYTYEKVIDLFYGEKIQTISDGNYTGNIKYVDSSFGKITYFNQGDYGKYYFSSNVAVEQIKGATIATHGCGPTSVAIVASSMLNRVITPIETTQKVCARNGCVSAGSYIQILRDVLIKDYGLNAKLSASDQEVINALGTGKSLVIALVTRGTFTNNAHFIVLTGVNKKGQVSVADPNSVERTNKKWFSFNLVVEQKGGGSPYVIVTRK